MMTGLDVLRGLDVMKGLNDAAWSELAARCVVRRFAPGETLWHAGDTPRGLFVLLEGRIRVIRSVDGRPYVVHTEERGGVLGDVPLFGGGAYPATAIAERRSVCAVITRDAIAAAIRHDPALAFRLLARLAGRVRVLIDRLDSQTGRSVTARVADFLLRRAATAPAGAAFTLGCTQTELAEELGTVREVVVRSLRELRTAGAVGTAGRGTFVVLGRAELERLAR